MFSCNECDKKYASQTSLARHRHNHRRTKQHVCSICHVIFYRSDLLLRHLRLHEKEDGPGKLNNDRVRRRCHTACLRCRELRTKCSGQQPCASCINTGSRCEYTTHGRRISRQVRSQSRLNLDEDPDDLHELDSPGRNVDGDGDEDGLQQDNGDTTDLDDSATSAEFPQLPQSSTRSHMTLAASGTHHGSQLHLQAASNGSLSRQFSLGAGDVHYTAVPEIVSSSQQSIFTFDAESEFASASIGCEPQSQGVLMHLDPFSANGASWPFLHESLFLSNQPAVPFGNLDYPEFEFNGQTILGDTGDPCSLGEQNINFQTITLPAQPTQATGNAGDPVVDDNQIPRPPTPSHAVNSQGLFASCQNLPRPDDTNSDQARIVNELVTYASSFTNLSDHGPKPSAYWASISSRINAAFELSPRPGESDAPTLRYFVDLYFKHFGPLWPLISLRNLELDNMHPLLFLVLTSIGAMYGGRSASSYGVLMHENVRRPLTLAIELDDGEDNLLWLAQARLLTQVAALYFGQSKAFSYSQHLGALLVGQARRMDLFSAIPAENAMKKFRLSKDCMPDTDRLDIWLQLETRRRLAFGIFRGATYLSVLLHTKPLVLMDEIDLTFPTCNAVWRSGPMAPGLCLQMIEHDRSPSAEMRASDVYRIAMDRHEPLPPLDPASHELLMFGLQWPLWQFSRDQEGFSRLTGQPIQAFDPHDAGEDTSSGNTVPGTTPATAKYSEANSIDRPMRQMSDLRTECSRFPMALQKWERALPLVKTFVQTGIDRGSLLSGLVLYHLDYVRLNAPIEKLHQIQYRLADNRPLSEDLVEAVRHWANSPPGHSAAERACTLWSLISREAFVAVCRRAKFNLLAFTALHHCAVLLWAYAGAHKPTDEVSAPALTLAPLSDDEDVPIPVSRSDCSRMLTLFVQLYGLISPARWSSFARAVNVLRRQEFPSSW
ncbi:hypothetical protein PV04_04395 [Phialophora macrospora]|uniref:C2H2-type domain-containing protein n=1 Tax=Phialophora macrospora TaxID=1851006 RepID=A0A0D2E2C6_9EURO|nr:hypothetical protein PV04_04395 [Phialophora macrospora]